MNGLGQLIRRDCKLFFKDKGLFFSSLISPLILLVLYATFLGRIYRDSFTSALPEGLSFNPALLDATVAGQLISSLLAVCCVTVAVCANLPYNITTPFLTACVESRCFHSLTVLIQKEVAQRICAAPGTADYGAFTLLMQYYTQPELLFTVPNTCFLPAPKVTSAVIRCQTRSTPPVQVRSEAAFWRTVRAGFALRRKTLVNSLQTGWELPKDTLTDIVAACGLSPTVRGERLGLAEYARLSDALLEASK